METKIKIGQLWTVKKMENGKILITDIDQEKMIIHFAYLKDNNIIIYHIPIDYTLFMQSIVKYIENRKITKKLLDAKKVWENHSGGIWEIEIYEIIKMTL